MAEPAEQPDKNIDRIIRQLNQNGITGADFPSSWIQSANVRSSDYDRSDSDLYRSEYEGSDYARSGMRVAAKTSTDDTAEVIGTAFGQAARRVQDMQGRFTVISGKTRASAASCLD